MSFIYVLLYVILLFYRNDCVILIARKTQCKVNRNAVKSTCMCVNKECMIYGECVL